MSSDHKYILITGANIGLGYGICLRLIDDFLTTNPLPSTAQLTLIFTTRSSAKSRATLSSLSAHLHKKGYDSGRIHLRPENVELTSLLSVHALAIKLTGPDGIPHLDALILNAGVAGTTGINWPVAVHQILTEQASAVTWPRFKLSAVGSITDTQFPTSEPTSKPSKKDAKPATEPPLGQVFCANLFGHYLLSHWTMPLLRQNRNNGNKRGRIIWISSVEASGSHFAESDLQGLRSTTAYEHSKRLTDLLVLTATSPETQSSVKSFFTSSSTITTSAKDNTNHSDATQGPPPMMLLAHPGIVATSIVPLPPILMALWTGTAYVARWLGSPWHTNTAYSGAASAAWLALAGEEKLENRMREATRNDEAVEIGRVKWGSAVDRSGKSRIEVTDVSGWGVDGSGGLIGEKWWGGRWGRMLGAVDASGDDVKKFVDIGAKAWAEMEALRKEWEKRVEEFEGKRK